MVENRRYFCCPAMKGRVQCEHYQKPTHDTFAWCKIREDRAQAIKTCIWYADGLIVVNT